MKRIEPMHKGQPAPRLVNEKFNELHGKPVGIFRAPGRVNLMGEHTDYNDGFVMPAALPFYTYVAAGLRPDRKLNVYSIDFSENRIFDLDSLTPKPASDWSDYVRGVAGVMLSQGMPINGTNLVIKGEVPIGAGLSSSAAIEVATAFALLATSDGDVSRREVASICQRAEHRYAGTNCGIMDQFISIFGVANKALLLDCRNLDFELFGVGEGVCIVICNTMVKHDLAAGEYNHRRVDCEAGVRSLQRFLPGISALRDVDLAQLAQYGAELPAVIYQRCHHVISENLRVLEAGEALKKRDLRQFGVLMDESHRSLRDDYQVSCRELDLMTELARRCRGVYGSRMTGGGFGGCTVSLVDSDAVDEFRTTVSRKYQTETGLIPEIYVCKAAEGASQVATSTL